MSQTKELPKRHIVKTLSYQIITTITGFLALWILTGNVKIGVVFSIGDLIYKSIQYYIHEIIWYRWIKFGLISEPDKKKKNTGLTERKVKSQIKAYDQELPKTQAPPPPKPPSKKVLNYSSNR